MELGKFLKQRDIMFSLCAASISAQIVMIADLLTLSCIIPIINKHTHRKESVEHFTIDFRGAKIEAGKILVAIIRFILVALILLLIYRLIY